MTGKSTAVFWIGFILILLNFWVTGRSAIFWASLTGANKVLFSSKTSKPASVTVVSAPIKVKSANG